MRLIDYIFIATLIALLPGCSGGNEGADSATSSETPSEEDDEGIDEPVWINGSYLTCGWERVTSDTEASVRCLLDDSDYGEMDPSKTTVKWVVVDAKGEVFEVSEMASGPKGDRDAIVTMIARFIAGKYVEAILSDGESERRLRYPFDELEGMGEGGELSQCFSAEQETVQGCFEAAGVLVDIGEAATQSTANKQSKSCGDGGDASADPDVLCEIKSDAVMGGVGTTWDWFVKGDNLIGEDGSIKAADFCDASGIKAQHSLGAIDIETRTYDYWDRGKMPCYDDVKTSFQSSPHFHENIVADTDDGVGGEPDCFFFIIKDPLIVEGYGLPRLHIVKNPKLFPDAANDEKMTLDRLKKTAEHFSCKHVPELQD